MEKNCKICKTSKDAAKFGHLDCLTYLHENGCPWDKDTCRYAAQNGHLDCLRYAHTHGVSLRFLYLFISC
jgi:hypothetical protein